MAEAGNKQWPQFVEGRVVKDLLVDGKDIISVKSDDKLFDILRILAENQILSVPVYDEKCKSYLGFIDVIDVATIAVVAMKCKELAEIFSGKTLQLEEYIAKESSILHSITAADIVGLPADISVDVPNSQSAVPFLQRSLNRGFWCPVWGDLPLNSLLDMFSKDVNIHRVPVTLEDGTVVGIVSQSRVVEEVFRSLDSFADLGKTPVSAIVEKREVLSAKGDTPLTEAFQSLLSTGVSGIAIVDNEGKVVGNLSGSDLKKSCKTPADMLVFMNSSVAELKKAVADPARPPIVSCTADETLFDVMQKMSQYKIHRVYVVDDEGRPIGLLSFSDLISFLSSQYHKQSHND